jgi:UDP-N-acetylmuramyl tripeptide synthase
MQLGDTLVIAGKGHEPYMEIGNRRIPWSDIGIASRCLHAREAQGGLRACA